MSPKVSGQLASKCAELTRCQTELRQAQHMLAAAYAANAAMQVRFQHVSVHMCSQSLHTHVSAYGVLFCKANSTWMDLQHESRDTDLRTKAQDWHAA